MKINSDDDFEQLIVARELVERGMRTYVISSLTGVPHYRIKLLYKLKGGTPKVGQSPKTRSVCRTRIDQIHLSIFATIYLGFVEGKTTARIDPQSLILSHDLSQSLCPSQVLNMTVAWSVATELRIGEIDFHACAHCQLGYLRIYESSRLPLSCPFCALSDRISRRRVRHGSVGAD
jgi:hypothetical protein